MLINNTDVNRIFDWNVSSEFSLSIELTLYKLRPFRNSYRTDCNKFDNYVVDIQPSEILLGIN